MANTGAKPRFGPRLALISSSALLVLVQSGCLVSSAKRYPYRGGGGRYAKPASTGSYWRGIRVASRRIVTRGGAPPAAEPAGAAGDESEGRRVVADAYKKKVAEISREESAPTAGKGKPRVYRKATTTPPAGNRPNTPATTGPKPRPAESIRRVIIYWATLRIEVPDKEAAMDKAQKLAEKIGGHLQSRNNRRIILRVPAATFFKTVAQLSKLGEVYGKEVSTQDVTEKYHDLKIRLTAALAVLQRMRELLQRAKTVKDAIKVEREIARLVEKIERMKGKIRYLEQLASMSTITIYFTTPRKRPRIVLPPHRRTPFRWVRRLGIRSMLYFRYRRR